MSGRKKLIFGNWKMHFSVNQATAFAKKLSAKKIGEGVVVAVAPTSIALSPVSDVLANNDISTIAQNAYHKDEGAFTGEISMPMLRGVAKYVLVGHSERRHVFNESNELLRAKMSAAVRSGIKPVYCIGETLIEREHYHTNAVISDQLEVGLADLTSEEISKIVIAYEPVWAIGTGKFADPQEVSKVVSKIRKDIASLYGADTANKVYVLYGGSVASDNCKSYLDIKGVDGLLVGGASLGIATFWPIVESAASFASDKIKDNK
jgi:triosephosphate isomerase